MDKVLVKEKVPLGCLYVLTGIFALLTIVEHWILVTNGVSAIRDHYISTTFLASTVFLIAVYFTEEKMENKRGNLAALIGKEYSAYIYIYIIHLIFVNLLGIIAKYMGVLKLYVFIAPIVVFDTTLLFLLLLNKLYKKLRNEKNCCDRY